jgi:hypothetical protein
LIGHLVTANTAETPNHPLRTNGRVHGDYTRDAGTLEFDVIMSQRRHVVRIAVGAPASRSISFLDENRLLLPKRRTETVG